MDEASGPNSSGVGFCRGYTMRMLTPRTWPVSLLLTLGLYLPQARAQDPAAIPDPAPAALTLEACIQLGLERQPSLAAARASLAAAEDNNRALQNLRFAALISHELPIRRQQASLGVAVAGAGVEQAEWDTTYAITRNYFSVLYARRQEKVAKGLVEKLESSRSKAQELVKKGDPDTVVTQIDVDRLTVNIDLFRLRLIQAQQGVERALAALREAIGLEPGCPLTVALGDLPALHDNLSLEELTALALARRGELVQASNASRVTELEVCAQETIHGVTGRTFAAVSDVHARPIPQGVANKEYRPWAIGLDMPTTLAGHRHDRAQRARDFSARAGAVVDKTRNLIGLEVEDAFLKWREAAQQLQALKTTFAKAANVLKTTEDRFQSGKVSGEEMIRAKTLESQVRAEYNEALYNHALALAALERITAGGFRTGTRE
jgi:outer membrane protein TolC